jgi:hypothetical protein
MTDHPRTVALAIGCAMAFALLLAGEIGVRVFGRAVRTSVVTGGCRIPHGEPDYGMRPDCEEEFRVERGGTLTARSRVSTDTAARRRTVGQPADAETQVLFFGCSYTWGWGLDDSDTLPSAFQSLRKDAIAWNLAMEGFGPHDALRQMENADRALAGIDSSRPTLALWVMIPGHVERVMGDANYVYQYGRNHPRYALAQDGALTYRGAFRESPLRYFAALAHGRSRLLTALAPDIRFDGEETRERTVIAVLRELERRLATWAGPRGSFAVVLFPRLGRDHTITKALADSGFRVFDYSRLPFTLLHPFDPHPNAATVRTVAEGLAHDVPGTSAPTTPN